jgi:hypothetical protein
LRTSQFGFIPANLFCICVYSFSIRSWLKEKHNTGDRAQQMTDGSVSARPQISSITHERPAA